MFIPQPYLLFLGDVTDPLAAKTARGIQVWRPEQCVGEMRLPGCTVSLGLDELNIAAAKAVDIPYYYIPFNGAEPDPAVVDTFLKTITAPGVQPAFIH